MENPQIPANSKRGKSIQHSTRPLSNSQSHLVCSIDGCNMSFIARSCLLEHMQSVHYRIRYPCPVPECNSIFKRKDNIKGHVRRKHPEKEDIVPSSSKRKKKVALKYNFLSELYFIYCYSITKKYPCKVPGCNAVHKYTAGIRRHVKEYHLDLGKIVKTTDDAMVITPIITSSNSRW